MTRFDFALAMVSLTLACTTALADPPNVRRYTPGDLFMGSGDPKTPLVYGENPINGSSFQINCTHPSCEVAVNFRNSYCSYIIYGSFFGSRVTSMVIGSYWQTGSHLITTLAVTIRVTGVRPGFGSAILSCTVVATQ